VDGGPGNDTLRLSANTWSRADGGPGDDQIGGGAEAVDYFDGGPGDDLIAGSGPFGFSLSCSTCEHLSTKPLRSRISPSRSRGFFAE